MIPSGARPKATSLLTLVISQIVWAMRICNPAIAASQFALSMAVANLSRSLMSGNSGWLVEGSGYAVTYFVTAGIVFLGLLLSLTARVGEAAAPEENLR